METRVIFIHSSSRVSSTWFWAQFRCNNSVMAFYEIFNERLEEIRKSELISLDYSVWNSKHPAGVGYFLEFLPLAKDEGGIDGFELPMALNSFIPNDGIFGSPSQSEVTYISRLNISRP